MKNAGRSHPLTIGGRTQIIADWAKEYGISAGAISARLSLGWTAEDAITTPIKTRMKETFADDLLPGAAAIADYLFGDPGERRKVYGLPDEEKKALGFFHIGKIIHARKSTINRRIAEREKQ